MIEALAGTGKTYAAGVLRELYAGASVPVIGVAPSARAARELAEQARIPARTLDSRLLAIASGHPLPEGSVVIFDEAGTASTMQTERLLAHAAAVGAKVVVTGDPGQLPSVQAGGWLRAIGDRLGAVELTEVMRQRGAAERFALAGLRDGKPQRWLDWATPAGRVDVLPDGPEVLEQAVAEWAGAVQAYGLEQSVLIARDNDTRRALNRLAREQRRDAGALGQDRVYGPVTVAVGDRVICRSNERGLDVDNGTRGIVRHPDRGGTGAREHAHSKRQLPATFVAEHVAHALRPDRPRDAGRDGRACDRGGRRRRADQGVVLHRALARPRRDEAARPRRAARGRRARGRRTRGAGGTARAGRGACGGRTADA